MWEKVGLGPITVSRLGPPTKHLNPALRGRPSIRRWWTLDSNWSSSAYNWTYFRCSVNRTFVARLELNITRATDPRAPSVRTLSSRACIRASYVTPWHRAEWQRLGRRCIFNFRSRDAAHFIARSSRLCTRARNRMIRRFCDALCAKRMPGHQSTLNFVKVSVAIVVSGPCG